MVPLTALDPNILTNTQALSITNLKFKKKLFEQMF